MTDFILAPKAKHKAKDTNDDDDDDDEEINSMTWMYTRLCIQ